MARSDQASLIVPFSQDICCFAGKLGNEEAAEGGGHAPPVPNFSKIKAVLFDIDGTMTDSDPIHFIAYALAKTAPLLKLGLNLKANM